MEIRRRYGDKEKFLLMGELDAAKVGFLFGKVDQERDTKAGGFEVRAEPSIIDLGELLNGFRFDDHFFGNPHIPSFIPTSPFSKPNYFSGPRSRV
jgi:hypothetical protein